MLTDPAKGDITCNSVGTIKVPEQKNPGSNHFRNST